MKYFVVKVKDKDLFFNANDEMGEFVCDTPILLDKAQSDAVLMYCDDLVDMADDQVSYSNSDLEVREVELSVI